MALFTSSVDTLFLLPEPLALGRVMALLMLPAQEAWRIRRSCIHRSAWRDCMKKGRQVVFRYSSMHERALPDGSIRCRMELHPTSHARSQRTWTTEDPRSSR